MSAPWKPTKFAFCRISMGGCIIPSCSFFVKYQKPAVTIASAVKCKILPIDGRSYHQSAASVVVSNRQHHKTHIVCSVGGKDPNFNREIIAKYDRIFQRATYTLYVCAAAAGGGALVWSLWDLKQTLYRSMQLPVGLEKVSPYLYPFDPQMFMYTGEIQYVLKKHCLTILPERLLVETPKAWRLFQDLKQSGSQRETAILKLAAIDDLSESECMYFSLYLDLPASISLANSGADPRLFTPPCTFQGHRSSSFKTYFGSTFRKILTRLPKDNIHYALNVVIKSVMEGYLPSDEEEIQHAVSEMYAGFDNDPLCKLNLPSLTEMRFVKSCLQAIVSHTRLEEYVQGFRKEEIIELLTVTATRYEADVEIMSQLLKIIANLTIDPSYDEIIRKSGWLRILAESSRSSNIRIVLPAKRALHNLDRDRSSHKLSSGVYQLYPDFPIEDSLLDCDIVFIHGIMGGVFRTWRQKDDSAFLGDVQRTNPLPPAPGDRVRIASHWFFNPPVEDPKEAEIYVSRYQKPDGTWVRGEKFLTEVEDKDSTSTVCWPREWLPKDCPNVRVIGMDFDSFVSHWTGYCPVETTKSALHDRAKELLEKLHAAGVGKRKIIWVTHSMGGLLAKSLLYQAATGPKEYQKICDKTKGIVFYSVPHIGSYMNLAATTRRFIFLPTYEAIELTNLDGTLSLLHDRFKRVWRAYNFKVLSFGESLETQSIFRLSFKMVPFSSADPGIGDFFPVQTNHLNSCKPVSRGSFIYRRVVEFIKEAMANNKDD